MYPGTPAEPPVSVKDPPVVLVVEDDDATRVPLCDLLTMDGYHVDEARNGVECLHAFERHPPDLILLDAQMPVMDGFTCVQRLRACIQSASTPILMVTCLEDRASVDRAFEAGATDFITKPIHWAVLRQRVRRLIEQFHLKRRLEVANRELYRLANSDVLTQLANRRRFDEYLPVEWDRRRRDRSELSLILCDIDFFKNFNDSYGHSAGDKCLRSVAQAIRQGVRRPADLVARYGGEEFAVILPNTPQSSALHLAEGIRLGIEGLRIAHEVSPIGPHVTLSLGVATASPQHPDPPRLLVDAADAALYQAKQGGRNQTCSQPLHNP
jgi:diguanylate cyclase (GGDEF)-like protein